jgi:hypothetical protein
MANAQAGDTWSIRFITALIGLGLIALIANGLKLAKSWKRARNLSRLEKGFSLKRLLGSFLQSYQAKFYEHWPLLKGSSSTIEDAS